jgi:hypothetical protein
MLDRLCFLQIVLNGNTMLKMNFQSMLVRPLVAEIRIAKNQAAS